MVPPGFHIFDEQVHHQVFGERFLVEILEKEAASGVKFLATSTADAGLPVDDAWIVQTARGVPLSQTHGR